MAFDREEYVSETGRGLLEVPVALQFADELYPYPLVCRAASAVGLGVGSAIFLSRLRSVW